MSGPQLREPGLPRTATDRPDARRTGWTTGACCAAAAKAAGVLLARRPPPATVDVPLPVPFEGRERVAFVVERSDADAADEPAWAEACVVKDAGDDPDVTDGAHLAVRLERATGEPGITFVAGEGVGTVTKPGLGLDVGGPAINPVPRRMIAAALAEVFDHASHGVRCVISVADGERMARKTTNRRLGIHGGISILGTTGVVRPFSTASWRASVTQAVDVLAAQGGDTLVLCTGGRTERAAMDLLDGLPEVAFVEVGDFTGAALTRAAEQGVGRAVFVGMAGKLTKLAAGVMMTHYSRSQVDVSLLACLTADIGGPDELVSAVGEANTGRHAYELAAAHGVAGAFADELCERVAANLTRFTDGAVSCAAVLVDFDTLRPAGHSASLEQVIT